MRKIAAIFVILALIMAVAVACGNGGDDTTTSQTIGTQYSPVEQPTSQVAVQQTDSGMSYVLTTQAERTVPWVSTTRFEITEAPVSDALSTNVSSTDYDINFNVGEMVKPEVNTSNATTVPKTTSDAPDSTKKDSTTVPDNSEPVQLIVNSTAYGGGVIYVEVDPSNWSSGFVSASQNINVKVNGDSLGSTVACKVPSSKTGDCYEIKIDLSSQDIPEGATVEFTIPTGIVKNKAGTQYNLSYSASIVAE